MANLRRHHEFDMDVMQPPFVPSLMAEGAEAAEADGYDALVIDSASMFHVGPGGYRDWHRKEVERMCRGDESKAESVSWRARSKPSLDRQSMLYRLLQRRIPIIFSCRARELTEQKGNRVEKIGWQPVIHQEFIYDMTVGLTLTPDDGKGVIRHRAPFKIERDLAEAFRDGDQITVQHGEAIMDIMRSGTAPAMAFRVTRSDGKTLAFPSIQAWAAWWERPLEVAPPEVLRELRIANGAAIGEYAELYPDVIEALEERMAAAIAGTVTEDEEPPSWRRKKRPGNPRAFLCSHTSKGNSGVKYRGG